MFKSKTLLVFLGTWILLCASCNNGSKVKIAEINNVEFEFEGPLYEGANKGEYLYPVDLKKLYEQNNMEETVIKKAFLKSAKITTDSCDTCLRFVSIKSLVLSIVTDDNPIKEIALLNPISSDQKTQTLNLAEEVDIAEYFNAKNIYWVLDADIIDEYIEDNRTLFGDFKIEFHYD